MEGLETWLAIDKKMKRGLVKIFFSGGIKM